MTTKAATNRPIETTGATDRLTAALEEKLSHPATSPDFDREPTEPCWFRAAQANPNGWENDRFDT